MPERFSSGLAPLAGWNRRQQKGIIILWHLTQAPYKPRRQFAFPTSEISRLRGREVLQHSANRLRDFLPVGFCAANRSSGNSAPKCSISSRVDKIHYQSPNGRPMHVTSGSRRSAPESIGIPTVTTIGPTAPIMKGLYRYLFPGSDVICHIKIGPGRAAEPSGC